MSTNDFPAELKNIWVERQFESELGSGMAAAEVLVAPYTTEDVQYVCNNMYPFIQLANADITDNDLKNLKFTKIFDKNSGWTIFDYGPLMSTAAPHYQGKKTADDEKGGEGGEGTASGGFGTIIAQQFNVAEMLVSLVAEKGWASVALIAGTSSLQLYFSLRAKEKKIGLVDFQTPDADVDRLHRKVESIFKEKERVEFVPE